MSNRLTKTHRRQMRPVTPMTKAVRHGAGMTVVAAFVLTGSSTALADATAQGDVAADSQAATTAVPAVTIPVADAAAAPADNSFGAVTVSTSVFTPAAPEVEEEEAPEAADEQAETTESESTETTESESTETRESESNETDSNDTESASSERETRSSSNDESSSDRDEAAAAEKTEAKKVEKKKDAAEEKKAESSTSAAAPSSSVIGTARSGIGVPYVSGGTTRAGWDCSGFVNWVYSKHGVDLPRTSGAIVNSSKVKRISASEARPGDLVYVPGHIGIYAGNGNIVDAGNSRRDTSERSLWSGNWRYYRVVG